MIDLCRHILYNYVEDEWGSEFFPEDVPTKAMLNWLNAIGRSLYLYSRAKGLYVEGCLCTEPFLRDSDCYSMVCCIYSNVFPDHIAFYKNVPQDIKMSHKIFMV